MSASAGAAAPTVALAGNPNVGKTSLFNSLTGARARVGNYPGVSVERRSGLLGARWRGHAGGVAGGMLELIDLPGTYSLTALTEDEAVAFRVLTGADGPAPDVVCVVLDASNLGRNLYLALQLLELGRPTVCALNLYDAARDAGLDVDAAALARALGVAVVPTVARTGEGVGALVEALATAAAAAVPPRRALPAVDDAGAIAALAGIRAAAGDDERRAHWLAACAVAEAMEHTGASSAERRALAQAMAADPAALERLVHGAIVGRYAAIDALLPTVIRPAAGTGSVAPDAPAPTMAASERIDRVLTHPLAGTAVFVAVMALVFQSIFSWAEPVMGLLEAAVGAVGAAVASALGPGLFTDLVTEGVVAGVGNVLVFVPQIALLFLCVTVLEDSGYLARAAFLLDRLMSRVGLHGRAFVPLLSGYACAIPGLMGTRTIRSVKDRIVTMLMIPYMSCSARLPIYALVIGALFDADAPVFGPFTRGGLVLLAMYGLSTASALAIGALYKRTVLRSPTPPLVLELPPYRWPRWRNVGAVVVERTVDFVREAGTVILAFTVVLWALLTFPRVAPEDLRPGETAIERSIAGQVGKAIEPALAPIGQDWRMGVGILGSFAAREVFVSTLGLVFGKEASDEDDLALREAIASAKASDGTPRYTPLRGVALMVFFVYACQCMSTVAVVWRETKTWRWPAFMFVSQTLIAYVAALVTFQVGRVLLGG